MIKVQSEGRYNIVQVMQNWNIDVKIEDKENESNVYFILPN